MDSRYGTLGIGEDGDFRIVFERLIGHPVATVWRRLADAEMLSSWLPGCTIEPRVGGTVLFDFGEEGAARGLVTAIAEPGENARLVHSWEWDGLPPSEVRWTLDPAPEGTRLVLVHRELVREPAVDFATGWHAILAALQLDLDGGDPGEAWGLMGEYAGEYARRGAA